MQAGRSQCFYRAKTVALALSFSFLSGQVMLANPEGNNSSAPEKVNSSASAGQAKTTAASTASGSASEPGQQATPKADSAPDATAQTPGADAKGGNTETGSTGETKGSTAAAPEKEKSALSRDGSQTRNEERLHNIGIYHWDLSKKYSKEGDMDLAQTELELAVMSWPDMKIAHRDLCLLSLLRFNLMRSVAEFMMTVGLCEAVPLSDAESIALMEDGMIKHYKKGLIYARKQDWAKTISELELASHLVDDDFAVQRALAFAYASQGNFSKAEEHYKVTFELAPHDGSSRADLAYFLAQNGNLSEAEKEMEEAVKTQPKAAAYHVDLGFMAERRGDFATASNELQEAVKLSPRHADLWAHLGRILSRKGDKSSAIEAYSKAIAINPQFDEWKQALNKLQEGPAAEQPQDGNQSREKNQSTPVTTTSPHSAG